MTRMGVAFPFSIGGIVGHFRKEKVEKRSTIPSALYTRCDSVETRDWREREFQLGSPELKSDSLRDDYDL